MLGGKSILNLSAFATMVLSTPSQFWLMDPTCMTKSMHEKNKNIPVVVAHKGGAGVGGWRGGLG